MEQDAASLWYYSQSGERHGPIPLDELKHMVMQGRLDPLSDLVWTQGLDAWKPIGEIPELFQNHNEAASPETAPAPAKAEAKPEPKPQPKAEPKPQPKPEPKPEPKPSVKIEKAEVKTSGAASTQDLAWPGIQRGAYFLMTAILPSALAFGLSFLMGILGSMLGKSGTGIFGIVSMLLIIGVVIFANVKRLQNLGMSAWWILGKIVPLLNLWVNYRLFACPAGYASHKKMDGLGIFLAILYWLWLLSIIASLALLFTIGLKAAAENPAIQEQLKALVEQLRGQAPATP